MCGMMWDVSDDVERDDRPVRNPFFMHRCPNDQGVFNYCDARLLTQPSMFLISSLVNSSFAIRSIAHSESIIHFLSVYSGPCFYSSLWPSQRICSPLCSVLDIRSSDTLVFLVLSNGRWLYDPSLPPVRSIHPTARADKAP